jgi:hypothetical protein
MCRAGKSFGAGDLDRRHPQPLDIPRMPDRPEPDPIINLEQLLPFTPQREQQDAFAVVDPSDGAAPGELMFDILTPIGDGFDPAVRFFDHTMNRKQKSSTKSSTRNSRTKSLNAGKIFTAPRV